MWWLSLTAKEMEEMWAAEAEAANMSAEAAYYEQIAADYWREQEARMVECEACEGSGRHLVYHNPSQSEAAPCNERDIGPCDHCSGSGIVEVETKPVECDDGPSN